jgi:peptidoglycan/LPS O-acetylase OafA/YrhL
MLQLDALRAFAVATVMIHHFTPGGFGYGATAGVKLFFSISGFLITGILLKARQYAEASDRSKLSALARFYTRRFLRIFPLYYLVVGVAYAINLGPVRNIIGSLLTYTLNIHMARQGWYEADFAHFWSLSVEEQFYICWPWLVLFLPCRWILPAILGVVSIGPLYRWSYVLSHYENMTGLSTYISTPTSLDHLGVGALLALAVHRLKGQTVRNLSFVVFPVSFLLALFLLIRVKGDAQMIFFDTALALSFCCLIFWVSSGSRGPIGRFLEWTPISYMGKVSYGLYVYHPFMPTLAAWLLLRSGFQSKLVTAMVAVVLTFIVTSVSWHFFEKPINDLKRYFPAESVAANKRGLVK